MDEETRKFENYDIQKENALFLSGKMLSDGTVVRGAILGVSRGLVGKEAKDVLFVEGEPRGLPLNATNRKYLIAKLGPLTGNWPGAQIEIFAVEGEFRGEPCWIAKVRMAQ